MSTPTDHTPETSREPGKLPQHAPTASSRRIEGAPAPASRLPAPRGGFQPPDERWRALPVRMAEIMLRVAKEKAQTGKGRRTWIRWACKRAGIERAEYREALNRHGASLQAWLRTEIEREMIEALPRVWSQILAAGLGGDPSGPEVSALKLYLERFDVGYTPRAKHEIEAGPREDPTADALRKMVMEDATLRARLDELLADGGGA